MIKEELPRDEKKLEMRFNMTKPLLVLILVFIGTSIGAWPKLNVPDEWVFELPPDSKDEKSLMITCEGDEKLTWITDVPKEFYKVSSNVTFGRHFSSLKIDKPVREDTGYFTCEDSLGDSTRTYVYVNDGFPFVYSNIATKYDVKIGEPIVLDCRTTDPEIEVTVFKDSNILPPSQYDFDPRKGVTLYGYDYIGTSITCKSNHIRYETKSPQFIMVGRFIEEETNLKLLQLLNLQVVKASDVTSQFENDSFYRFRKIAESRLETGIYSCRENLHSQEITWLISVEPRKKIEKPSIETHRNSFFVVGVEFSLNCSVPWDSNDRPFIKWKLPNPSPQDFQQMDLASTGPRRSYRINKLTMKNPTLKDSGTYVCNVSYGGNTQTETKEIEVQESIAPFVKFDKKHDALFVKEMEAFQWVLYFDGFPSNLSYTFYDPLNKTMRPERSRVSMNYDYEDGKLSLEINQTRAEDFGQYRARLTTPNSDFDETSVLLIVNATPKVHFEKIPDLLPINEKVSLKAHILAFSLTEPDPKVLWWFYDDCPKGLGSCVESSRKLVDHHLKHERGKPRNHFESTVSLRPHSGVVKCEVSNFFGRNSTQVQINISDKKKAFLLTVFTERGSFDLESTPNDEAVISVIEGDTVTIECFALAYLYQDLNFISNGSYNCSTQLSSGKCITVNNVDLDQEDFFQCQAVNKISGKNETLAFTLRVIEKLAPGLLSNSTVSENGEMITVKASEPFSIACYVYGKPRPNITWLKDGIDILDIEHFVDNERVILQEDNQILEFKFAQRDYDGRYTCFAENRVGLIEPYVSLQVLGAGLSAMHWVLVSVAIVFIFALCMVVIFLVMRVQKESKLRRQFRQNQLYLFEKGNIGDLNKECTIDEQAYLLPYDRAFEVDKDRIKLGKQLGAGAFGRVMQAYVDDLEEEAQRTRVAVKMCKDGADMAHLRALTLELKIMVHLGKHLNIVNLMGAYTVNMEKGDLWILVEYCKYGNLLKHIQKYKSRFVNQVDPVTGLIEIHRMTPLPHESFSPTSLGRYSYGTNRTPPVDADGYLETRSHTDSIRGPRPFIRQPSIASNAESLTGGTSRPGLYVGNPHYTTVGFGPQNHQGTAPPPVGPPSDSPRDHYVTATQLPSFNPPPLDTSTSENGYHLTLNTEMTGLSSPPPFSPASSTSEPSFFGNPLECDGIPGVSVPFTTTQLVCWAWQVANGMEYLTRRKVLHGDLAARNLLLAENNVVKISDFGLSRDMYKKDIYMKQGDEIMPIKWMAPEAIQQKVFSIQSDVWAFGITLWEMFTLGNTPYPGVPLNQDFPIALENGMRMENPKYSNDKIYDLMMRCWSLNPLERPSFSRIADMLSEMLTPESRETYVAMNDVLMRKNEEWMEFKEDYLNMLTTPDFQNIEAPVLDQPYIPMQAIKDVYDEGSAPPPSGYLDMKSVRSSPAPETIFSPRPQTPQDNDQDSVFTFVDGPVQPLSDEHRSPVETSSLLGEGTPAPSPTATSKDIQNNNIINKLPSLNQPQPHYQNLDKVLASDSYIEPSGGEEEEDTTRNYINLPNSEHQYVNTSDVV